MLDTGDIQDASKAYSQIQGIVQEITAEWVRAGVPIERLSLPWPLETFVELDTLVGKQIDAGAAGVTAGAACSGFLFAIPAIQLVIGAVNALIGAAGDAGAGLARSLLDVAGMGKGASGRARGNPFDVAATTAAQSDGGAAMGVISGVAGLMRKLPLVYAAARHYWRRW